jgi:hypothetical protein
MTDYSKMDDNELNEAIAVKLGWRKGRVLVGLSVEHTRWADGNVQQRSAPDYTHDWRLAGELLEELPASTRMRLMCMSHNKSTMKRHICVEWLAWKEQE